jgi:hypothetical protein
MPGLVLLLAVSVGMVWLGAWWFAAWMVVLLVVALIFWNTEVP